jgi:hypothetical protein
VTNAGPFRFKDRRLFLATAFTQHHLTQHHLTQHHLTQHHIGLDASDSGLGSIDFGAVLLARLEERDYVIRG